MPKAIHAPQVQFMALANSRPRGQFITGDARLRHFSCKSLSSKNMEMEVGDCLAGVGAAVGNEAVAALQTLCRCNLGDLCEDMSYVRHVICVYSVEGGNVGLGDNENMCGCLRLNVTECENKLVLIHLRRWNIARYYFTENTHYFFPSFLKFCAENIDKRIRLCYNGYDISIITKRRISVNGCYQRFYYR